MTARDYSRFWVGAVVLLIGATILGEPVSVFAQDESPKVKAAKKLIRDNGKMIGFFALPTYTYSSCGFNKARMLDDGFELTYTMEFSDTFTNTVHLKFYFDKKGGYTHCETVKWSSYWTPFTDGVGTTQLKIQRDFMRTLPSISKSGKRLRQVQLANSERLLALYLKLEQS